VLAAEAARKICRPKTIAFAPETDVSTRANHPV
jgi:hypothetical protein